ncbi:hypothetical protein LJ739_14865 [Aestuariibacter halophilus]|uniref:RND efflux pump membrane fusion protein barrel-sandwich domain-containing protein n=1 Tax=Fluctibacter halophilus TaxID=226011 RepID=A0ABS8GAJ9_9ALTE|nr:hypothetical protein [Aestuariibacter halophilus]MCC2617533.1 hypothetical protein [Aestuariibacter halophilus]
MLNRLLGPLLVGMLLLHPHDVFSQTPTDVPLSALSSYTLTYVPAEAVAVKRLPATVGHITYRPGDAFEVTLPFAIQQFSPETLDGQWVEKGQTLAYLDGREVHHFFDEAASAESLFLLTKRHYERNRKDIADQVIKLPEWLAIAQAYEQAKLAYEHTRHAREWLSETDNGVALVADHSGYVEWLAGASMSTAGQPLLRIIPGQALRLEVAVSASQVPLITAFSLPDKQCVDPLTGIRPAQRDEQYWRTLWVDLASDCSLRPGQTVRVEPIASFSGWRVPGSALMTLDDQQWIAVLNNQTLELIPVDVRATDAQGVLIETTTPLGGRQVLNQSLSVVQGYLMGMGGE